MKIQQFPTGPLDANCYLLVDEITKDAAVLDPGGPSGQLDTALETMGEKHVKYILLTHGHFDHIGGVATLLRRTNAKVLIMEEDGEFPRDGNLNLSDLMGRSMDAFGVDRRLRDGDCFMLGKTEFKVLHTPGHTCGSCCYLAGDALFTGDTLMNRGVGRTDFPTGNYKKLTQSLNRLCKLPGDYTVYPGHGEPTTLEQERNYNPYLGMVL